MSFAERAEDVELEPACGCSAVDALVEANEGDTHDLQLIEQRDKVLQIPTQAVEPPAHQHVELPAFGIGEELVERRPAVLRAADAAVHILDRCPTAGLAVAAEFLELVLRFLIEGGDAGVDGARKASSCASAQPSLQSEPWCRSTYS